ncbi:MAG: DUF952 domain-containing protein [Thermomicrobiales bacterium]
MTSESALDGVTFHMTPREVWNAQAAGPHYQPEAYEADGYIHCTDVEGNLPRVANDFYSGDAREQIVLVIDVRRIEAVVKYEDPECMFPHIYGPLNVDAVMARRSMEREPGGAYLRVGEVVDD